MNMDPIESATAGAAQDVESRIEEALFPQEQSNEDITDDAVIDDAETLPEDDDAEDAEIDDDSADLEEVSDEDVSLASYLGIDEDRLNVDDDGKVTFKAIIDGESKDVDLKELAKSYQLQGHVNNKSIALENDRKEFESTRDTTYTELKTRVEGIAGMHKAVETMLLEDYQSVDWDALRHQDPSEWAALREEFSAKARKLQQAKGLISEEAKRIEAEQAEQNTAKQNEYLQAQYQQMIQDNPAWEDQDVMTKDVGEIGTFLNKAYGFNDDDLRNLTDSRLMRLVRDAKAYREGTKKAEQKKVTKGLPKFQKPGSQRTNAAALAKARAAKAQKKAIKDGGGSVNDIANSILDRM